MANGRRFGSVGFRLSETHFYDRYLANTHDTLYFHGTITSSFLWLSAGISTLLLEELGALQTA